MKTLCKIRSRRRAVTSGNRWAPALAAFALAGLALGSVPGIATGVDALHVVQLTETGECPGCDLRRAKLDGLNLDGALLSGADLRGASLSGATLRGADLRRADLRGLPLHDVNILGADLRGADLRHLDADTDLEFVTLIGVRMEGARFKHGVVCGKIPEKGGWGCEAR